MTPALTPPPSALGFGLTAFAILLGALITAGNLRTCLGPQERRFTLRACLLVWALTVGLLALMYHLQPPWRYLLLGPYLVVLPILTYRMSYRRQLLRHREQAERRKIKP